MNENRTVRPGWRPTLNRRRAIWGALPLLATIVGACTGARNAGGGANSTPPAHVVTAGDTILIAHPALDQWPEQFRQAAPDVQEGYRYAVASQDILKYIPCYCGCVNQGYTSNRDCYVRESRPDGSVVLDPMSFG